MTDETQAAAAFNPEAVRKERDDARAALLKYAVHPGWCLASADTHEECTCGLREELTKALGL